MNTLGAVLGWFILMILSKKFKILMRDNEVDYNSDNDLIIKLEPYLYIIIAIISVSIM